MFWLLKYFDNFKNFTSHSMSMLSSTRKLGSKGSTLSKSNLDMMKNSSHRDEYPAMQSNGPLPQVKYSEKEKKITPDCCLLVLRCSSFSNILIILTILLLTLSLLSSTRKFGSKG